MGGTGSGRYGGRPTVESSYAIDINELVRSGLIQPGRNLGKRISWSGRYGAPGFEVEVVAILEDMDKPRLYLSHVERNGSGRTITYAVELVSTPQHLGGRRWWFRCPTWSNRVGKLHLPCGAARFACRDFYQLGYATQRATLRMRAIMRCHRIRRSLGADVNPTVPVWKPHGMHHATFDRKMTRLRAAEGVSVAMSLSVLEALKKRMSR